MDRKDIYEIIDEERKHQDSLWGGRNHDKFHEPESWIIYMEHYIAIAKKELATKHHDESIPIAMDNMRKVVALGIACLENYGCPSRDSYRKNENKS